MNKGTMFMLGIVTALAMTVQGGLDFIGIGKDRNKYNSGPKGIPSGGRHRQGRPHAPNDGHWHMKFHRSRS